MRAGFTFKIAIPIFVALFLAGQLASAMAQPLNAPSSQSSYKESAPAPNPDHLKTAISLPEKTLHVPFNQGIWYRHYTRQSALGPLNINILEIDPQNPNIVIQPTLANSYLRGKAKVLDMALRNGAIAGVNASYFKPDTGTTLGTFIMNKELISGPLYQRVSLGITPDKKLTMSRLKFQGSLLTSAHGVLQITNINQPRLSKNEFILYSPRWGYRAPNNPIDGLEAQVVHGQITQVSTEALPIPSNGYVLVGPANLISSILHVNDQISLTMSTLPDWSQIAQAISGGPYLVKNGQIYIDFHEETFHAGNFTHPAPRTAAGITANNHLILVTVDGRQSDSVGVTLGDMAYLMKSLGAVDAMNLDGGSSTQMIYKGRIVNSPSVAGGAPVGSALLIKSSAPILPNDEIGATDND